MVRLRVNELLKDKKEKPYWLVKKLGSTYANVNPLLNSSIKLIHLETIDKLCNVFNCQPGDLFVLDEDSEQKP